jgi:hypothetical protein
MQTLKEGSRLCCQANSIVYFVYNISNVQIWVQLFNLLGSWLFWWLLLHIYFVISLFTIPFSSGSSCSSVWLLHPAPFHLILNHRIFAGKIRFCTFFCNSSLTRWNFFADNTFERSLGTDLISPVASSAKRLCCYFYLFALHSSWF